jgi:hypothetical protein
MKRAWGLRVVAVCFVVLFASTAGGQNPPPQASASGADGGSGQAMAAVAAPARLEAVRLQGLCLLAAPDSRTATVRVLRAGEVVRVVATQGEWVRIEVRGGVTGFVQGGYLTGASGDVPALYRDKMAEVARRPGPGDAPGTLIEIKAGPQAASQDAVPPQSAPAADGAVSGEPAGCGAMAPSPAAPTASGVPVTPVAPAAHGPTKPGYPAPTLDPQGIDSLVAHVLQELRKPAPSEPSDRREAAAREHHERTSRFAVEVYLDVCKLVLFEKQADGNRHPTRSYAVATPAGDVEPPTGWGVITQIEFEPWWRPTENMKRRAKQKGRTLPDVMPPGAKNPMGPFKMHLSHGFAFRIHGNNDPKSIGRRVTNGCIRMRNDEGLELARILDVGTEVVIYEHAPPKVGQGAEATAARP